MVSPSRIQVAQQMRAQSIQKLIGIGRVALWFILTIPGCLISWFLLPIQIGGVLVVLWPFLMMAVVATLSYVSKPMLALVMSQHVLNASQQQEVPFVPVQQSTSLVSVQPSCTTPEDILDAVYITEEMPVQ